MKLAVSIEGKIFQVTPRTGEKYIYRAILGAIVESGHARALGVQAGQAARAISAGLDGYHWNGPPAFHVEKVE